MYIFLRGFPGGSNSKESVCSAGDLGSTPGSERFPREGNGYSLRYSCLENPMDRGAWWATVHGVEKSQTRLSDSAHHMSLVRTFLDCLCNFLWLYNFEKNFKSIAISTLNILAYFFNMLKFKFNSKYKLFSSHRIILYISLISWNFLLRIS